MPIVEKKDGRIIRTGSSYTQFRLKLYCYQSGQCAKCEWATSLDADIMSDHAFHCHHKAGRGLGGSKRDDTFEACEGLCGRCHRKEHHQ
jgi:hypothetical protein